MLKTSRPGRSRSSTTGRIPLLLTLMVISLGLCRRTVRLLTSLDLFTRSNSSSSGAWISMTTIGVRGSISRYEILKRRCTSSVEAKPAEGLAGTGASL